MGTADDGDPERSSRQALLDAALRLVAERPPSSISGRELAVEAGVNYGLIHHYFGSKQALLQEGLASLAGSFAAGDPDGRWSSTEPIASKRCAVPRGCPC